MVISKSGVEYKTVPNIGAVITDILLTNWFNEAHEY